MFFPSIFVMGRGTNGHEYDHQRDVRADEGGVQCRKRYLPLDGTPLSAKIKLRCGALIHIFYQKGEGKIAEFIDTGRMHKYDEIMAQKPQGE